MNRDNTPATKTDVEEIVTQVVTKVVGNAKTEILSAVGDKFEIVNDRLDNVEDRLEEIQTDASYARSISLANSNRMDSQEKQLKTLKLKVAKIA